MTTTVLTDDLVVEILSRLPLKSFCRFKCVSKSWLAFSSDLHYRQKLPRTPVGLLYQKREHDTAIHLAGLPSSDRDIDTTLSFVPCSEHPLELKDCSNGLLLLLSWWYALERNFRRHRVQSSNSRVDGTSRYWTWTSRLLCWLQVVFWSIMVSILLCLQIWVESKWWIWHWS